MSNNIGDFHVQVFADIVDELANLADIVCVWKLEIKLSAETFVSS
jgi:hypothetical protein